MARRAVVAVRGGATGNEVRVVAKGAEERQCGVSREIGGCRRRKRWRRVEVSFFWTKEATSGEGALLMHTLIDRKSVV